ncbi:MAG: Vi polysaccharide biosynthesis UDP-N-acetylglucosamine C-6 dehydrogenase TviB [Lentisphaeria bacterium]|nr:Vi polysaccharide biosynthesis UDP-N-acetylglucosamine C-6 dehydrogenase TviB [Lentisphaeria bacterium]NQZ66942.1 Vi polysaccharide biosynthesis UDP-N-acetylglucosamine C-6 dehydrogenase TviB [Lentisphaeria bacterium]
MNTIRITVIGLGYVGLPLAVEFSKKFETIGFDVKEDRIKELQSGNDSTLEVEAAELNAADNLSFTANLDDIKHATVYIVTVPTPIDTNKRPDLTPLIRASETVAKVISAGNYVVYESTVYPGATEEVCIPIIEKISGLKFNTDFFAGYSPERINPGDKEHRLPTIIKVTSGSTPEAADFIDDLYAQIITAGTHKTSCIKVAEAAKVIENTQRDLNIALVNELALIFDRIGIDTLEVLEAAGTKWNFLPFRPGLVGGHCIGVDPYYLTHKAQELGYHPEIILSGRRLNDNMGAEIARQIVKLMIRKEIKVASAKVLVLGITFKENCPDIRNSRVIDLINELKDYSCDISVYDPWADTAAVKKEYGLELVNDDDIISAHYDAIVLAVAHDQFKTLDLKTISNGHTVIYDIKSKLDRSMIDGRL